MNISCDVIRDLLPLYHDGVCSAASKCLVEEHLAHCESCRSELQSMAHELPLSRRADNLKEAEAVKTLSRRWKKGMLKSVLKGALFTLAAILVLLFIFSLFVGTRFA